MRVGSQGTGPEHKYAVCQNLVVQLLLTMKRRTTMKMLASLLALGLMATPALAATQTFNDVSIVDVACSKKTAAAGDGDAHTRECALGCKDSGFGILTADNKFLKFDA